MMKKKTIPQQQNNPVFCSHCGESNIIKHEHKLKYAPKFYFKSCSKCRSPIEGEWKKLLKGK